MVVRARRGRKHQRISFYGTSSRCRLSDFLMSNPIMLKTKAMCEDERLEFSRA